MIAGRCGRMAGCCSSSIAQADPDWDLPKATCRDAVATPTLTHRAVGAAWWSALEISARYGVQFVVVLALARLLSPGDFGLIAMLLVFTSIGTILVDAGFGTALIQRQTTSPDDETTVFWLNTAIGMTLFAALWFGAPAIAGFYGQPALVPLTRLVAFVLPISALSAVPDATLTQQLAFKARAKAQVAGALCSALIALVLAWSGYGVWSLAWQAITAAGVRAAMLWIYSGWRPIGRFRWASFHSLVGFGGYMLLSSLLDAISLRLQSLLIGVMFEPRALGYYTLAQSAQSAPTSFMGAILNRVGLPVFAAVGSNPAKLAAALRLSLRAALFIFVPCMTGMALMAGPLIELLYGQRWNAAAPILTLLALSSAFWPLHVLNLAALSAQGHSRRFFLLEVVKKLVAIGLILTFSSGGPTAIAGAVLVSSAFGVVVNTWYSGKLLDYGLVAQMRDQLPTLTLVAFAALTGWALLHWTIPSLGHTIAAILAAAAVYLGLAAVTGNQALKDLSSLARTFFSSPNPAQNSRKGGP